MHSNENICGPVDHVVRKEGEAFDTDVIDGRHMSLCDILARRLEASKSWPKERNPTWQAHLIDSLLRRKESMKVLAPGLETLDPDVSSPSAPCKARKNYLVSFFHRISTDRHSPS